MKIADGACAREVWFAGMPVDYPEKDLDQPLGWFTGAVLEETSTPHFGDWTTATDVVVHLFGAEVMPDTTYEIQLADSSCTDLALEDCYSSGLTILTAKWGDVRAPFFVPGGPIQPDFGDISAVVDKFMGLAHPKAQTQLQPEVPDPTKAVDFKDIGKCVDALKGEPYPYDDPAECQQASIALG